MHKQILVLFLFTNLLIINLHADDNTTLSEEFISFNQTYLDSQKRLKKGNLSEVIELWKAWETDYPDSLLKKYVLSYKTMLSTLNPTFSMLLNNNASKVKDLDIPLKNGKTAKITGVKKGKLLIAYKGKIIKKLITTLHSYQFLPIAKTLAPGNYKEVAAIYQILFGSSKKTKSYLSSLKKNTPKPYKKMKAFYNKRNVITKAVAIIKSMKKTVAHIVQKNNADAKKELHKLTKALNKSKTLKSLFLQELITLKTLSKNLQNQLEEEKLAIYRDYPIKAGERGRVECMKYPSIKYDIYLPPKYNSEGSELLPLIVTFNPGGGGMVSNFQKAAEKMNVIVIGCLKSKNRTHSDLYFGAVGAIFRDARDRLKYNPNALYVGGFSGGASTSYSCSQLYGQHLKGVIAMGGWLGNHHDNRHDWHPKNYLVARISGSKDKGALSWLDKDKKHLDKFDVKIKNWQFPGAHSPAPTDTLVDVFQWFNENKVEMTKKEKSAAKSFTSFIKHQEKESNKSKLFKRCLEMLLEYPGTPISLSAQKQLDILLRNKDLFSTIKLPRMKMTKKLEDFLGYTLLCAALVEDHVMFNSSLKCITHFKLKNDVWFDDSVWFLSTSQCEKIMNAKAAMMLVKKAKKKQTSNSNLISIAAAYKANGQTKKASDTLGKVDIKWHNNFRYKKAKEIIDN